ncbi:MAG: MGMT family protein [Candidatus Aenigmarchaeota archaeon]|nr:MGMT family protein [Candidatus Aenigmarchaeota archaeon]
MHKAIELLKKIPKGKITTYKELARATGTHPRVIGAVMHSNEFPREFPCYKVVMSDGRVGGYGGGVKNKIKLLKKDGIIVKDGKINLEKHMFKLPATRHTKPGKR